MELNVALPEEIASGADVHVAIRPERARLSRAPVERALAIRGTVREVFYLGATREFRIELADGEKGIVEAPNDGSTERFEPGDDVWFTANVDDCRVLPV
jgi:ABC-type Fe3+/spermidine/putrescine transport system ATPase subunit